MSKRANALAERIEQGAQALATFISNLSNAEWNTVVPHENRTVGVVAHHVASVYPLEVDLATALAAGQPIAGVTWDVVAHMNAQHAHANAAPDQPATVALLRQNSQIAASRVREFSDDQLDSAATVSLNGDAPLTAQFFIEDHALRHSFHHLANIRAALAQATETT